MNRQWSLDKNQVKQSEIMHCPPPPMSRQHIMLPTIIMTKFQLVIFSLADYLLAGWSEKDDVFILCCVAALDVTERRVWVHNPRVTKCHQVLV